MGYLDFSNSSSSITTTNTILTSGTWPVPTIVGNGDQVIYTYSFPANDTEPAEATAKPEDDMAWLHRRVAELTEWKD